MLKKRGFTLIELMVVVAIIGVLAAMLVPQITNFTQKARDARRIGDIRNLDTALLAFYSDNARYPTPGESGSNSCGGWRGSDTSDFMQILAAQGYIKSRPADPINNGNGCTGFVYSYYRYTNYCGLTAFYVSGARTLEGGPDPDRLNVGGTTCGRNWANEFDYISWAIETR